MDKTIYGREAIRKWLVDTAEQEQDKDAYRMKNVLFILEENYAHIRVYTDQFDCVTSLLLDYDAFAICYMEGRQDITLLSRKGDTVLPEMYIGIKGVLA